MQFSCFREERHRGARAFGKTVRANGTCFREERHRSARAFGKTVIDGGNGKHQDKFGVSINRGGADLSAHGVVRYKPADLTQWTWDEFTLSVTRHTLSRELRTLGYRKLSARPRHRA